MDHYNTGTLVMHGNTGKKKSPEHRKNLSDARRKWWAENGESAQKNRAWLAAYASDRMTRLWAEARANNLPVPNMPAYTTDPVTGKADDWYDI